jgi:hypothetical protein
VVEITIHIKGKHKLKATEGRDWRQIWGCRKDRRDERRRKYSKMDKGAKDKLARSPGKNGGG